MHAFTPSLHLLNMCSPEVQHLGQCPSLSAHHSRCQAHKAGACLGMADGCLAGGQRKRAIGSCGQQGSRFVRSAGSAKQHWTTIKLAESRQALGRCTSYLCAWA